VSVGIVFLLEFLFYFPSLLQVHRECTACAVALRLFHISVLSSSKTALLGMRRERARARAREREREREGAGIYGERKRSLICEGPSAVTCMHVCRLPPPRCMPSSLFPYRSIRGVTHLLVLL
jgi:hypothetical protein